MEQNKFNTKKRTWKQLNEKHRYKIEAYLDAGMKASEIAELIGYSKRTIQREIKMGMVEQVVTKRSPKKNDSPYPTIMVYKADVAQARHNEKASAKGRNLKIGFDYRLAEYIEKKIHDEKWSPDAVIGNIKKSKMKFKETICTKTLYNYIDMELFNGISNKNLLYKKKAKKRKINKIRTVALNNRNGKSIDERPEEVENRKEIGHWEIDLVVGKSGSKPAIMTLVERKSRKSIYIKIKNKTQEEVLKAIKKARKHIGGDYDDVFKSITADNGSEFLNGEGIKKTSGCKEVYYAHPYSSWERGSNENGNRILRRFIPKNTDIGEITEEELKRIEDWVNNYPRKILGYKSANEMYVV